MIGLTAPQQAALSFIRTYRDEHGLMPSCAEIAAGIGAKSKSRASQVLASLEERGALRRLGRRARAIELIDPDDRRAVLLNREIYRLLSAYASGMHISIDTAASELLRGALGAA